MGLLWAGLLGAALTDLTAFGLVALELMTLGLVPIFLLARGAGFKVFLGGALVGLAGTFLVADLLDFREPAEAFVAAFLAVAGTVPFFFLGAAFTATFLWELLFALVFFGEVTFKSPEPSYYRQCRGGNGQIVSMPTK